MEIVKKNMTSIICGAVALLAIIGSFWPLGSFWTGLKEQADGRVTVYNQLDSLVRKNRNLPVVDLGGATEPLKRFPNEDTLKWGNAIKEKLSSKSTAVADLAMKTNRHDFLESEALPDPLPPFNYRFMGRYRDAVLKDLPALIKAGAAVTEADVVLANEELKRKYDSQVPMINNQPDMTAKARLEQQREAEAVGLRERLIADRAAQCNVYVDPGVIGMHAEFPKDPGTPPNADQIWFAQLQYWVYQDVLDAIRVANGDCHNVLDAPVKRIKEFTFTSPKLYVLAPGAGTLADPPSIPTIAITGRASNALYDVVHVARLSLIVQESKIPAILNALERNRYLTVLNIGITSVDSGAEMVAGYLYGPLPVVQLDLQCELLYLREWTKPKMPPDIVRLVESGSSIDTGTPGGSPEPSAPTAEPTYVSPG